MNKNTSLAHKSIKNSLYNVIGFIWPIGLSLVFAPYIVHKLGNDAYGILAIVSMVMGYFAFLNLGLGSAGLKYVSEYYAKKDYDTVNSIINILILIYGILGIIGLISILALTNMLATKVFKIPMDMVNVTKFALYLSAFGFLVTFIKSVFEAVPKALYRFDIENKISIVFGSSSTLFVVLILYLGYGLKEVVVLRFVIGLAILSVFIMVVKKLLPFYKLKIKLNRKLIKKLFSFGIFDLFTQLTNITTYHAATLIIGVMLGPFWLTYYVIPQKLTQRVNGFIFRLSEIVFPLTSELSGTRQYNRLTNIYLKMSRITLTFKLAIYIPLILFSYKILYFWMGEDFAKEGWLVMVFLCFGFFMVSLSQIPALVNLGCGKPKLNAIFSIIDLFLFIIPIVPLTKLYGIKGTALAWIIGKFVTIIFIYISNKYTLKIDNILFFKEVFIKPLIVAGIQSIIIVFILVHLVNNIFSLLLCFCVACLSYFVFAYIIGVFRKEEKLQLLDFVKSAKYVLKKT